jgi:hypothetical protein
MTKEIETANPRLRRGRFARIPKAQEHSGWSRSRLYLEAGRRPGLFRKDGRSTLVDLDVLDEVLDELPVATIKPAV